eukprot:3771713-Prymnesium_polylepis.1
MGHRAFLRVRHWLVQLNKCAGCALFRSHMRWGSRLPITWARPCLERHSFVRMHAHVTQTTAGGEVYRAPGAANQPAAHTPPACPAASPR